jgi:hypothetical protein
MSTREQVSYDDAYFDAKGRGVDPLAWGLAYADSGIVSVAATRRACLNAAGFATPVRRECAGRTGAIYHYTSAEGSEAFIAPVVVLMMDGFPLNLPESEGDVILGNFCNAADASLDRVCATCGVKPTRSTVGRWFIGHTADDTFCDDHHPYGGPLKCNCADTPPTMPTCRSSDDHLPSCPKYVTRSSQESATKAPRQVLPHTPGFHYPPDEQAFLCGGSGKLTPESRAELEAFRYHLQNHKGQRLIAPCRFCEERKAKLRAIPREGEGTEGVKHG